MSATILAVVGSKGGVGKSAVAFNLALAYTRRGKRAVVVDLDLGFRCQSVLFGTESDIVFDLSDMLATDSFDLDQALRQCPFQTGLYLLPACADPFARLDFERLSLVFAALRTRFDIVILDTPPSVSRGFIAAISLADSVCVVTVPEHLSIRSAALCARLVAKAGIETQRLIINKAPEKAAPPPAVNNYDKIIDDIGIPLLGVVPYYAGLDGYLQCAKPMPPKLEFSRALDNISRRLDGEDIRLLFG